MKQLIWTISMMAAVAVCHGQSDFHDWAPVPPMGWNSWDCYGPTVTEAEVRRNADFMAAHLKAAGWQYIIVDIRWYVDNDKAHGYNERDAVVNMDGYGRLTPSVARFPSAANEKGFRPLADYIHSRGLLFGIHMMRGIPVKAVEEQAPVKGTSVTAADIYNRDSLCAWLKDMYTVDSRRPGAQEYYNSLFELYASWGLDFVKVDDLSRPYHRAEIEMIRRAIDRCGRKIVLSMSPGATPPEYAGHAAAHANMWRLVDDFWDAWKPLKEHFDLFEKWNPYRKPGAWPDGDMLPMGRIGIRAERGDDRTAAFTHDELKTMMTLFIIARSPLMFGGDLPTSDAYSLSLISNTGAMNVLRKSRNNRQLFRDGDQATWLADEKGSKDRFAALFNTSERERVVRLELGRKHIAKDLWSGRREAPVKALSVKLPPHGAALYRLTPVVTGD